MQPPRRISEKTVMILPPQSVACLMSSFKGASKYLYRRHLLRRYATPTNQRARFIGCGLFDPMGDTLSSAACMPQDMQYLAWRSANNQQQVRIMYAAYLSTNKKSTEQSQPLQNNLGVNDYVRIGVLGLYYCKYADAQKA